MNLILKIPRLKLSTEFILSTGSFLQKTSQLLFYNQNLNHSLITQLISITFLSSFFQNFITLGKYCLRVMSGMNKGLSWISPRLVHGSIHSIDTLDRYTKRNKRGRTSLPRDAQVRHPDIECNTFALRLIPGTRQNNLRGDRLAFWKWANGYGL